MIWFGCPSFNLTTSAARGEKMKGAEKPFSSRRVEMKNNDFQACFQAPKYVLDLHSRNFGNYK